MIPGSGPPAGVKVVVATKPVDFRRGIDGLARSVKEELRADPFCGVVYVFRAKRADRIKLRYWDESGLALTPSTWNRAPSRVRRSQRA